MAGQDNRLSSSSSSELNSASIHAECLAWRLSRVSRVSRLAAIRQDRAIRQTNPAGRRQIDSPAKRLIGAKADCPLELGLGLERFYKARFHIWNCAIAGHGYSRYRAINPQSSGSLQLYRPLANGLYSRVGHNQPLCAYVIGASARPPVCPAVCLSVCLASNQLAASGVAKNQAPEKRNSL